MAGMIASAAVTHIGRRYKDAGQPYAVRLG